MRKTHCKDLPGLSHLEKKMLDFFLVVNNVRCFLTHTSLTLSSFNRRSTWHLKSKQNNTVLSHLRYKAQIPMSDLNSLFALISLGKKKKKKPKLTFITIPSLLFNNLHQIMTIGNVLRITNTYGWAGTAQLRLRSALLLVTHIMHCFTRLFRA